MMSGLFDRYFQLLAGRVPATEYGVIADPVEDDQPAEVEEPAKGCFC